MMNHFNGAGSLHYMDGVHTRRRLCQHRMAHGAAAWRPVVMRSGPNTHIYNVIYEDAFYL